MQKISDRKTLIKTLKQKGFILLSSSKHQKWSNGKEIIIIPHKHSNGGFSRILAERIMKKI